MCRPGWAAVAVAQGPVALRLWVQTLRRLPRNGIFWQVGAEPAALAGLQAELVAAGLGPDRLAATGKRARAEHQRVAPACGLAMDTLAHNGWSPDTTSHYFPHLLASITVEQSAVSVLFTAGTRRRWTRCGPGFRS